MRKKMESLGKHVTNNLGGGGVVKFTESPTNTQEDGKYFLEFYNTHKIAEVWSTQLEAIEGLEDVIKNGVRDGSHEWFI